MPKIELQNTSVHKMFAFRKKHSRHNFAFLHRNKHKPIYTYLIYSKDRLIACIWHLSLIYAMQLFAYFVKSRQLLGDQTHLYMTYILYIWIFILVKFHISNILIYLHLLFWWWNICVFKVIIGLKTYSLSKIS